MNTIRNISEWSVRYKKVKGTSQYSMMFNKTTYFINTKGYSIKYINDDRYYGRLIISCNISRIYNGTNSKGETNIDKSFIKELFEFDLGDIVDFNKLSDIEKWGISRDETFIDMLVPNYIVDSLYKVYEKTNISRKTIHIEYRDKGTIYFHSGKGREHAGCLYKIYDKVRECKNRGEEIKVPEGYTIIRFEVKYGRSKIRHSVKDTIKVINKQLELLDQVFINTRASMFCKEVPFSQNIEEVYYNINLINDSRWLYNSKYQFKFKQKDIESSNLSAYTKNLSNKATFLDTCDIRYQQKLLVELFRNLKMDKDKLTRLQLLKSIDSIFETTTTQKSAKKVVKYLNGEIKKPPFNSRRITAYKNKILNNGVHYIYSDIDIPSIMIEELERCIYSNTRLQLNSRLIK